MEASAQELVLGEQYDDDSLYETSHVLGSLLASSPLLPRGWRWCEKARAANAPVADEEDGVVYVAFPSAAVPRLPADALTLVPIGDASARALFRPLASEAPPAGSEEGGSGQPVAVQALALQMFRGFLDSPDFQMSLRKIQDRPVVFTGHSVGGTIASLAALHQLSTLSSSSASSILCITFGSPLLGNAALARAIMRERWSGNFCHVVAQHDIVPRLLFCPMACISPLLAEYGLPPQFASSMSDMKMLELRNNIKSHMGAMAMEGKVSSEAFQEQSPYAPFGCFALCSEDGAVCIDSPDAVVQMLHATFTPQSAPSLGFEAAHSCYGDLVMKMPFHLLLKKTIVGSEDDGSKSQYDSSVSLALATSGITAKGVEVSVASESLKISKRISCRLSLNPSNLAIKLANVAPYRAQIEWYKNCFDDTYGYYDAFKSRLSPVRYGNADMNRIRLGQFWDKVFTMFEDGLLPPDFHKRAKWVNAAQFYKLLVEPLDIADYYRKQNHLTKGHYLSHGRERRYRVSDRWWAKKHSYNGTNSKRSTYASQTQDSCFWARVEEAKEWLDSIKREGGSKSTQIWQNLEEFACYSAKLIERKEVSKDVLAPKSSYVLWFKEWTEFNSRRA